MPKINKKNPPVHPILARGIKEFPIFDEVWDGLGNGTFTRVEFILFIIIDSYGPQGCSLHKKHFHSALHIAPRTIQEIIQKNIQLGYLKEWYHKVPYQENEKIRFLKTAWMIKSESE